MDGKCRDYYDVFGYMPIFAHSFVTNRSASDHGGLFGYIYKNIYHGTTMGDKEIDSNDNISPCCMSALINPDHIRKRPLEDYIRIRYQMSLWIKHTLQSKMHHGNHNCSVVMEHTAHVLFGNLTHAYFCNPLTGVIDDIQPWCFAISHVKSWDFYNECNPERMPWKSSDKKELIRTELNRRELVKKQLINSMTFEY